MSQKKTEIIGDFLFVNGKVYVDALQYTKLQEEYSRLLAESLRRNNHCKMVVMKGGIA